MLVKVFAAAAAVAALGLAAPVSAQNAPAQRCFITYFPAGSSDINPSSQAVVQAAVTFAGAAGRVKVTAHRDGAETDDVSLARAASVTTALASGGVARPRITTDSVGFSRPAVPSTGAEPLNRRVEMCVTAA